MKNLVVYSSSTGNTKKVAEAIGEEIGARVLSFDEVTEWQSYDFIAVGFYNTRGFAEEKMQEFMEKIKNKKVGVFATLGAYPDSDHAKDTLVKAREFVEKNQNEVLCEFICQGAIDPNLIQRMRKLAAEQGDKAFHPITPEREQRWKDAASHPDETDLENAKKAFSKIKDLHE